MFQLIRKDSGEGVVYAVGSGRILVASLARDANTLSSKKSCGEKKAGCGHCGGCASLPDIYSNKFHIPVSNADTFKIGDRVNFTRYIPEPNIAGLLVFGIPIASAIVTMALWLVYAPEKAESLWVLVTIVMAFTAGIAVISIIDRLFKKMYPITITGNINNCVDSDINDNINNSVDGNISDNINNCACEDIATNNNNNTGEKAL